MEDIEITCPNCKAILPVELKRVLVAGMSVTCENCGIVLVPKLQGEPSKAFQKKEAEPASVRQTVKKTLRDVRTSVSAEMHRVAADLRRDLGAIPPRPEPPAQPVAPAPHAILAPPTPLASPAMSITNASPPEQLKGNAQQGSGSRKHPKPGSPERKAELKQEIENAKRGLRSWNEASLVLMRILLTIFYIASIGKLLIDAFTGQPFFTSLVQQTPLYITGAFLHWYETHRIHEWVKQGVYEFYGVDMIIVGIVGCSVYGIGVLMLIKGFIVMGVMLAQDKVTPKARRDVIIGWINGFDEVSWYIAALAATAAFIVAASLVIGGFISLSAPSAQFIAFIIMGICGIVAANSDLHGVSKSCREYQFDNLGGKSMVNGIIGSICFGAGTPMIIKAILLFVIDGLDKKQPPEQKPIEQPLPRHDASLPAPLITTGAEKLSDSGEFTKPAQPPQPTIAPARNPAPAPALAPAASPLPVPARKKAPSLQPKAQTSVEAFLHRSFNVLTPKIRKRLLRLKKLSVSDADIEEIAEELVHHPEFQQLDIIDEYIQLNKADEVDPMHVLAVRNMAYDENTKKWMLDQLRSIPDKDVPAFIDEMKRNQPTP